MEELSCSPKAVRRKSARSQFLELLPQIRRQASHAFRHENPELRDELIAEVAANAYCAFKRLADRGRAELAYATPLAQFAIRQVRIGRRVGTPLNRHDVSSPYARYLERVRLQRLDRPGKHAGTWNQVLLEDRRAGPAETAAARIDVAAWFQSLPLAKRKVASALAAGERTEDVARQFDVTPGRISQLRRWFRCHWNQFHAQSA